MLDIGLLAEGADYIHDPAAAAAAARAAQGKPPRDNGEVAEHEGNVVNEAAEIVAHAYDAIVGSRCDDTRLPRFKCRVQMRSGSELRSVL